MNASKSMSLDRIKVRRLVVSSLLAVYAVAVAGVAAAEPRVMSTIDMAIDESGNFGQADTSGQIREDGSWQLWHTVFHSRLRCGTYETGIQLGKGAQCAHVEWLNEVQYGSSRRQCNSAALIHNAAGSFDNFSRQLQGANCVRVVVRCTGTCG